MSVSFFVAGVPIPQGSKTAYVVKGRAVLVDANKNLKPWRKEVTRVARASGLDRPHMEGPVQLMVIFVFERPKSVKRRLPAVAPDLDKLTRAIGDAITDAGVWKDDGQVCRIVTEKVYGTAPGVHVSIEEMSADVPTRGERLLAGMSK